MPVGINQPSNQIKLTNVSLVRMKRGKKRFEIACYKNKVLEYRAGTEKDLDNVLQIPNVFLNVSKGQDAPNEELKKAFPGKTRDEIILEILNKGELQVGEKERQAGLENIKREVVEWVAGRVVDPKTKRVYTHGMIEKALDMLSAQAGQQASASSAAASSKAAAPEGSSGTSTPAAGENGEAKKKPMWTGVVTTKDAKSQALLAIKALIAHQPIPVARARMRLRITCPTNITKQAVKAAEGEDKATGTVKDKILSFVEQVESQDVVGAEWEVVGFVEPGAYKTLTEFIGTQTKGKARAEVLDMAVVHEGD
ncbi:SBDS family rRNA metabolism protein [Verruconis gallopava]|uniref:SBDS family rRNA metabolism protein n=1 Tax=Verruconis gallopava TaxID=253628 RepID=A0A0D1YVW3_9PEZI|nr:SBDS family rRNA metabolism protein [Verruconis gallopava]KIW04837.1 SBDS family rRNA metabolism protein [Verruconis gallopava]